MENLAASCWKPYSEETYKEMKKHDGWILACWVKLEEITTCKKADDSFWVTDKSDIAPGYILKDPDYIAEYYFPC